MAVLKQLRFEQTEKGVKLTGYGAAPHGRKYRIGVVQLDPGVSTAAVPQTERVKQLGLPVEFA